MLMDVTNVLDARFSTAPNDTSDICVGDRVMALWKDGTQRAFLAISGVVVRINPRNLSYAILYDDGYMDRHVNRVIVKKMQMSRPRARVYRMH